VYLHYRDHKHSRKMFSQTEATYYFFVQKNEHEETFYTFEYVLPFPD